MNDAPTTSAQPLAQPHIVPRTRAERLRRRNIRDSWYHDLYHRALVLRWYMFLLVGCTVYIAINVGFAGLYLLQPGSIMGARPGFWDAFFFSIQTIATIGYGQMYPGTFYCNVLVTLETMTGLVFVALATGVTFARISRPTARVMFARVATIAAYNGVPTLHFRLANERVSQILEADVAVSLIRYERSREGVTMRRFYDLALLRSHTPVFAMSFTIMHPIDARSPLYGLTYDDLVVDRSELLVTVTGLEEMTSQTVHARHAYQPEDLRFGHRFRNIFTSDANGTFIDYAMFHDQRRRAIRDGPCPAAAGWGVGVSDRGWLAVLVVDGVPKRTPFYRLAMSRIARERYGLPARLVGG